MNINQISQQDLTDYIQELYNTFKERFGYPVFSQDNPCWKPFRYYIFLMDKRDFYIATKTYWDIHHSFDDTGIEICPDGFDQVMESCFTFLEGNIKRGKQRLIDLGMTEVFN